MSESACHSMVPLSSLVEDGRISYGIVQPGDEVAGGIPIVRVKDLKNGVVDTNSPLRVAPEVSERHARTVLRGGEVLLSLVGTIGEAAVAPPQLAGWNVARAIAVIRPKEVEAEWLRRCFKVPSVISYLDAVLNTTVQATLNLGDLGRLLLPLPDEQFRAGVLDLLGALDDKIVGNCGLVSLSDQLAAALVEVNLDQSRRRRLDEVASVVMGSSPPGDTLSESSGGHPFYQGVRDFGVRAPKRRVFTTAAVRLADRGDSLVSVRAPVGAVNLAAEMCCIGRGVAAVRSVDGRPYSLFHILRSAEDAWEPFAGEGTIFPSINRGQLVGLLLPTVRHGRAEALEENLTPLEKSIASMLAENEKLAELRDTLLPQLMSGRLRVRDAEKQVEAVV